MLNIKKLFTKILTSINTLDTNKQPKTMSQTIGGQTTVEGCLSSLNSNKVYTTDNKGTSSSVTVNANQFVTIVIPVEKSGWTPLGIVQLAKSGGSSGYCVPTSWYLDGNNNMCIVVYNVSNSFSATVSCSIKVLYVKN